MGQAALFDPEVHTKGAGDEEGSADGFVVLENGKAEAGEPVQET